MIREFQMGLKTTLSIIFKSFKYCLGPRVRKEKHVWHKSGVKLLISRWTQEKDLTKQRCLRKMIKFAATYSTVMLCDAAVIWSIAITYMSHFNINYILNRFPYHYIRIFSELIIRWHKRIFVHEWKSWNYEF